MTDSREAAKEFSLQRSYGQLEGKGISPGERKNPPKGHALE
jgi:hypothetical protein